MSGNSSAHLSKPHRQSLGLSSTFRITIWTSIIIVFILSFLDLAGWVFNISLFKSIEAQWTPMKIITALCFIFAVTALVVIQVKIPAILRKILPGVLAAFICLVSLITLYVYIYKLRTGHESALTDLPYFSFFLPQVTRMALLTASNFLLVGFILFLLSSDKPKANGLAHFLIIPVSLASYFVLVSYILGVYNAVEVNGITVALNTSIAFFGISAAILLMRPDTWILKVFSSIDTGGIIARKLLPTLIILPVVIGWVRINGERSGIFKSDEGVVLVALTYTICFLFLVWVTARSVNKIDENRRASEKALSKSEKRLKYHFENSPLAVVEWEEDFIVTQWSLEAERIFGWKKSEVIGKSINELNIIVEEDLPIVEKTMERLMSGKELKVISSNRNYTKNREVLECIWYNTVLLDEKDQLSSVMSLVQDITALRRTEKELIESKEKYKELITNARSLIFNQDSKGRITFINEYAQNFFGYKEEEMIGKTALETIVPQTESTGRNLSELVENIYDDPDKYSTSINENIKKNGERVWIEWHNKALFDNKGRRTGHIAFGVDITKRKKAEESLKESEDNLRSVLNATLESIYMFDREGKFTMSNATGLSRLNNITEEKLIGHHFSEFMTSELARQRQTKLDEVFRTGKALEFEDERSGIMFYHNFFPVFKDKEVSHVVTYSRDITESKRTELDLHRTKKYLENLINYANAPIIVWNPANEIQLFNHAFERLTAYLFTDVAGKKLDFLFPEDSLKLSNKKIKQALTRNWQTIEIPILTKNKEIRTVLWNSANIYDSDNKTILSTIAQGNDITERIKAELEVRNSKEKLDLALENARIGIWEWDIQTDEFEWDKRIEKMFGLNPDSLQKKYDDFELCIYEEDVAHFRRNIRNAIEKDIPFDTIFRIRLKKDEFNYINTKALVEKDSNGKPVKMTGVCFDITEMKKGAEQALFKLNEDLTRSNKELEQFAYVASHDLQEPLRMVSSFTQLLSMRYKDKLDQEAQEFIKYAVDGAFRMQNLINDLLEYSRIETRGKTLSATDMQSILVQTINNLSIKIKEKNARITNDELPTIIADGGQMVQLFQNLIGNALKFCNTSPRIHISAKEEPDHYLFTVKDNGIGIEPQYFERIFQIFQRLHSKDEYGGTGIGLAICRRIVERHGGKIWVESKPGTGTKFNFTIRKR